MGEVLAMLLELVFQTVFELLFHGAYNGTKRTWYRATGKPEKRQESLEDQRRYHEKRMATAEELRQLRIKRKYRL